MNRRDALCFDSTLSYEIKTVKGAGVTGGGIFNSVFSGHGSLGLICEGNPLVIPVSPQQPVYVDTDAVVGWTARLHLAAPLAVDRFDDPRRLGRGRAAEAGGTQLVVVRPSEATPQKAQQH